MVGRVFLIYKKKMKEIKLEEILKRLTGFEIPFEEISIKGSLIKDIEKNGIKVPLEFLERYGHLRIVHGVHRLVSAIRLNLNTIPVIIINGEIDGH